MIHRTPWFAAAIAALPLVASAQTTIGPAIHVDGPAAIGPCNETTMSAAASNPLEIVSGWNDYRDLAGGIRTGGGISLDGGKTWSDVIVRPPPANQASVEGDPMSCYDDRTGALWLGGISFAGNGGVYVARKDPGAPAFNASVLAHGSGSADKGWMAAGVAHNDVNATRVYIAYNLGVLRSSDLGNTWQGPVGLSGPLLAPCPRVGPNGELYVVYWDTSFGHWIKRSFDGGVSFGTPIRVATRLDSWGINGSRVAGDARVTCIQGFACDPVSGTLYVVYPDTTNVAANGSNLDIYFTKSTNQGVTWTTPARITSDGAPMPGDQYFPWIEVDRNGRLHLLFYDTRRPVQNDSAPLASITPYYSYSDDGGAQWTEAVLGPAWSTGAAGFNGTFIGDYLGLATAGRVTTPLYLSTQLGSADMFTHRIQDGPASYYCFGINCPCGNADPRRGCGNAGFDADASTGASLVAGGSDSLAADDLTLTLSGLKPNAPALLLAGGTLANVPFGDGRRCIGGILRRYAGRLADASGEVTYGAGEIVAFAAAHWGAPLAGQDWSYQGWYRDTLGPCGTGFGLTNAAIVNWKP